MGQVLPEPPAVSRKERVGFATPQGRFAKSEAVERPYSPPNSRPTNGGAMPTSRLTMAILVLAAMVLACSLPVLIPGATQTPPAVAGPATSVQSPQAGIPPTQPAAAPAATIAPSPTALHAEWPSYQSETCGFAIRFPPDATLTPGEEGRARIDLPLAAGTNLEEKYLEVACREGAVLCASPQAAGYAPGSLTTEAAEINGIAFGVQSAGEGAAGNFYEWRSYSTTRGELCLSLTFILHSVNAMNYNPPLAEYDHAAESSIFGEIMSTFEWVSP